MRVDGFKTVAERISRPCAPGQRDEQMNQKEDDFAHFWIVAKRGQNDEFWLNVAIRHPQAVKGNILGRKMLAQVATIVTPDTILRWHRELVAAK